VEPPDHKLADFLFLVFSCWVANAHDRFVAAT
jgi:hypothetical protein